MVPRFTRPPAFFTAFRGATFFATFRTAAFFTAPFLAPVRFAGARFVATFLVDVRLVADRPPDALRTEAPRFTAFFAAVLFIALLRGADFLEAFFTAVLFVAERLVTPFFAATFFTALLAFVVLEREAALRALVRFAFIALPRAGARPPVFFVAFAMVWSWL